MGLEKMNSSPEVAYCHECQSDKEKLKNWTRWPVDTKDDKRYETLLSCLLRPFSMQKYTKIYIIEDNFRSLSVYNFIYANKYFTSLFLFIITFF